MFVMCNNAYSNLIMHICKHSGERPYVCDVCNMVYCDKSSLLNHKHIHSGGWLYACNV